MTKFTNQSLNQSLNREEITMSNQATPATSNDTARWMSYSLAAAAGLGATTLDADAEIIYSGVQDISIDQFSSINLNLDGDGYNDVLLKNYVFGGGNYQGLSVNYAPGKLVGFNNGLNYASALAAGDMIDSAATSAGLFFGSMAYGTSNPSAQFNDVENAFLGLEFVVSTPSRGEAPTTSFAWIRVSIDNDAGTFIVHDWAYNSILGEGIQAGQVPAPSTLAFLAVGAAGVQNLRRRRNG